MKDGRLGEGKSTSKGWVGSIKKKRRRELRDGRLGEGKSTSKEGVGSIENNRRTEQIDGGIEKVEKQKGRKIQGRGKET